MKSPTVSSKKVRRAAAPPPTPELVADRLLALAPARELPALWSRAELSRRLTPAERPALDAALARLQDARQMLALGQGKSVRYLFAGPLRRWLDGSAALPEPAEPQPSLDEAYRRLVRESGGFPDVKISALQAASGSKSLAAELVARWRRGDATLSMGDWSLASEETQAAAVELDGEKYLLVRLGEME